MKHMTQNQWIYVVGGILTAVMVGAMMVIFAIGKAYQKGLTNFQNNTPTQEVTTREKKTIRKITLQKEGETGCTEITFDGIVRTYDTCNEKLSDANRLTNLKNVFKLFKLVSEEDLSKYKNKTGDTLYTITVETDTGTQIYYLVSNAGTGGEIIKTVNDIKDDAPHPSARPTPSLLASRFCFCFHMTHDTIARFFAVGGEGIEPSINSL